MNCILSEVSDKSPLLESCENRETQYLDLFEQVIIRRLLAIDRSTFL